MSSQSSVTESETDEEMTQKLPQVIQSLKDGNEDDKVSTLEFVNTHLTKCSGSISSVFKTNISQVIESVLDMQKNFKHSKLLQNEVLKFWYNYLKENWPLASLSAFLPQLLEILLGNFYYQGDPNSIPTLDKCFPYDKKTRYFVTERERNAYCLHQLANAFGNDIWEPFLSVIQDKIVNPNYALLEKETVMLALGIVARPCMDQLGPFLLEVAPALLSLTDDPLQLLAKTTRWAILCSIEIYIKVCPIIHVHHLKTWDPSIEYDPKNYFKDLVNMKDLLPDVIVERENRMDLVHYIDNVSPLEVTKFHEFVVMKLIWLRLSREECLPDSWMHNFGVYLEKRVPVSATPEGLSASLFVELNPAFGEELPNYFNILMSTGYNNILLRSQRKELPRSLSAGGSKRTDFIRWCKRIAVGLCLLGIRGNRLIDHMSIQKFFMPYILEEEKGIDPEKLNKERRAVFNHIHEVPPQDMWGLQVVKYEYTYCGKIYFQVQNQG